MTTFGPWTKCSRCARSNDRWGIYAPIGHDVEVLVLTGVASRASQATGIGEPHADAVAERVARAYNLAPRVVHVDALLACGPREAEGHEVAACTQRLDDQAHLKAWRVKLVVLLGEGTARLARAGGRLDSSGFLLAGQRVPVVVLHDLEELGQHPNWQVLGAAAATTQVPYPHGRAVLVGIMGLCSGFAWRPPDGTWQRTLRRVDPRLVDFHLTFNGWLSPYRPKGHWPFVVIDVDKHNAVQSYHWADTVKALEADFKNSLWFRSSWTGGRHVYVRLPPYTSYSDAAVWLSEYFSLKGTLIVKHADSTQGAIHSQRVDVPLNPPRLPFGWGSELLDCPPGMDPVARFEAWLRAPDFSDFERARDFVTSKNKGAMSGRRTKNARWCRVYIQELQLGALRIAARKLQRGDPWIPYVPRLAPSLRKIVSAGCPAFGTRTGLMLRIAEALPELVDKTKGKELLRYWLQHRRHLSEDLREDPEAVLAFGDRIVDDEYGPGVPAQTWETARAAVLKYFRQGLVPTPSVFKKKKTLPLSEEECLRAAFTVVRLFHKKKTDIMYVTSDFFGRSIKTNDIGGLPFDRANRDRAPLVRAALESVGLIQRVRPANRFAGLAADYRLLPPYWPPPLTGRRVYVP